MPEVATRVDWRSWTVARGAYTQLRVIGAVLLRESGIKSGKSLAFGFLTDATEPLMIIAVICFFRWVLADPAKWGTDVVLFAGTGVFPSWLWVRTSLYVTAPVKEAEEPHYPIVTNLDRIIVAGFLHLINTTITALLFFGFVYAYGDKYAMPYDLWMAISCMLVLFVFGLGVGLINSVIGQYVPVWGGLWSAIARAAMHFSAIFFVPDLLAPKLRRLFWPNPVTHGVSWFRHAFYPTYPNMINDHNYVYLLTLITLPVGLLMVRLLERREEQTELMED